MAGLLGCVFGVLGIFTLGILFVPLAAICSLVGLLNGLSGNGSGLATSALGAFLTAVGFVASPSLWFLAGGLLVASHVQPSLVANPPVAVSNSPATAAQAPTQNAPLARAIKETESAMAECRAMRLNAVLKSYEASAICSGDRMMQAFADANYKHMDLIAQFTAKRIEISRMQDQRRITEAHANEQVKKAFSELQAAERQRDGAKN